MADTLDRLARLSPERRALLQKLMQAGAEAERDPDRIRRRSPGTPPPLSFAQQRLWFVDQLAPGTAAYNMPFPLRLRGRLEAGTLRRALSGVVRRHEALRTVFAAEGGEPVQVVLPPAPVPFPAVDLSGLSAAAREAETGRLAREEARRPFDLARGPLLRATLLRLDAADHAVLFTLHHVVSDGWSTGVLARELSALYGAFLRGEGSPLPELPVQYADYAVWQRAWLAGERLDAQLAYWRERLAGAPPVLELPADRPARATADAPAGSARGVLDPAVTRGVAELARREGATPFMVLLAAWQLLLGRWADQDDVVVGTPVAGRTRAELEGLIGFFVNTLALRTDLAGDPSFRELLGRVRVAAMGAYEHQDLPFERLVEALAVERSLAHTPVFQAMFALQNVEAGELRLGEARMEPLDAAGGTTPFALGLALAEDGDRIGAALSFRSDLFEEATAARMLGHFGVLLEGALEHPGRRISEIPLLDSRERERLLRQGCPPPVPPGERTVPALFAAQAALTPDAAAVSDGEDSITYAELEQRSGRIARGLRSLGVGPETPVGICLEPGPRLLAAVLGVWKAGGAYVPLDPGHPAERLAFLLADAAAPVVLTEARLAGALPEHGEQVVLVDGGTEYDVRSTARTADAGDDANPAPEVGLDTLAYVIHTSGSTGRPKGVRVTHGSLLATARAAREAFGPGPGDRVLSLASFAFDIWLFEALLPLLAGASVRLLARERVLQPERLAQELEDATVVHAVPALMRQAVQALRASGRTLPRMRRVFVGGDAVPPDLLDEMREVFPAASLHVLYGPTEATVICAAHRARAGDPRRQWVGRPLGNAALRVLDRALRPVPVGVPGELCIGGASVARDYLGRPELTAEKWVPDPFTEEAGARLYRTGDRVRWTPEEELEFLGRTDAQVKVRGFRIEPGEVEAVLAEHPAVAEAAVAVREDAPGERRLVGYVVPSAGGGPALAAELKRWLAERLPAHMVPSALVALEALPLTPTGKTDRRALPAPDIGGGAGHVAPRTPTEEVLAGIWAGVLGLETVGVHDDFFAAGGHSLLATRVASRVRDALGAEMPLRLLFEHPTVAGLGERLDALRGGGAEAHSRPLLPVPRDGSPLPLSFAQQRLWFIDRLQPGAAAYVLPFPLRLHGALDVGALRRALSGVVRRHEVLRTVFALRDGEPVQEIRPAGPVPFPVADLAGLPAGRAGTEAALLAAAEALRPFDLERGPLLRAVLARLGPEDHAVLFTLHHVVSDGWSTGVLTRELSALYGAFSRGAESPLPDLPVQYADYAVWQRERLGGALLEEQLRWWAARLADAPPALELPADRPRPPAAEAPAGSVPVALSPELSGRLHEAARREGATPFMVLLAGLALLLSRWSWQDSVVVGAPVAGRTRAELEGLIGFFVNTLALRVDLDGDPSFRELLGRVRETTLGAFHHQELPFERLVEELQPERSLSRTPLFQAMFVVQNAEEGELRLGDLRVEPLPGGEGATPFDLDLALRAAPGKVAGTLRFRSDLFEAATAERMAEHFRLLLEGGLGAPEQAVSALSLLAPGERTQVLEAWNATARDFPRERSLHELVAAQAVRSPAAPAVVFEGRALSYAELREGAGRLAHRLRALGVGPETRVGICVQRGPATALAILGVLEAGGAYVPLDPAYPAERLEYMLGDSGARVLVTEEPVAGRLPEFGGETVLLGAEDEAGGWSAPSHSRDHALSRSQSLAYVIYTSGSTGTPKGVAVPHRAVVNFALDMAARLGLGPGDRVLQFASPGFDVVVEEIFPAWLAGAAVVFSREELFDPGTLLRVVEEEGVTALELPTSYWHEWVRELAGRGLRLPGRVRAVLVGGERVSAERLREWAEMAVPLVHVFGLTETACTSATLHLAAGDDGSRWSSLPVGRPTGNARLYVLDRAGQPVPARVPGELFIGGEGVARGYLGRPGPTAARFVPDPFGGGAGARLFRTGDRVRWLDDGTLEFLGRIDHQVKVRGFRVEPGEVEAALERHPRVREAVVLARGDALVGYFTAGPGAPAAGELRAHLGRLLPEHMVPSAFVALEAFPLTPNGKLDRRALPAPEAGAGREYAAPRGATERALAEAWAEVLGTERVGVHDDFFELGGHSLLATRLVSRVREAFGVEVPLRALFERPTVAGLAELVDEASLQAAGDDLSEEELRALEEMSEEEALRLLGEE